MLTFFSIPKAFRGHIGVIQRNAIRSWRMLRHDVEIVLFGTDEGVAEVAREFDTRHVADVERNEFGSILIDSVFSNAQKIARHDTLCYVNCDIVLMDDFAHALQRVRAAKSEFLMIGQRWDVDIAEPLAFEQPNWQTGLLDFVLNRGKQRPAKWIDYFAFSRGLYGADMPPFAIGRTCWDNWLVWKALHSKKPVIDVSQVVFAVHQNHDYAHHPQGELGAWYGEEAERNAALAGGWNHLRTVADAPLAAHQNGLTSKRRRYLTQAGRWGRFVLSKTWYPMWFSFLNVTRSIRSALGLRAAANRRAL